jgi:hypothetical protein
MRRDWSFFFTKIAGQPHGEELRWIRPFYKSSPSWVLSLANSFGGIQYGLLEISAVLGINSILNSTSRSGGNPSKSLGKTFGNSHTIGTSTISFAFAIIVLTIV